MQVNGANIKYYLDNGLTITSKAAGRVGRVTRTDGEAIYIRQRDGSEAVTSFISGDPVAFVFHEDYYIDIINEG